MSYIPRVLVLGGLASLTAALACSGNASTNEAGFGDGGNGNVNGQGASSGGSGSSSGGSGGSCVACLTDSDCGGGVCAQFGGDTYCAAKCTAGGAACGSGESCTTLSTAEGSQVDACVPRGGVCGSGGAADAGAGSSGGSSSSGSSTGGSSSGGNCGPLAAPGTASTCSSCSGSSSSCQANGCYGGWYCDTQTSKCQAPPAGGCGGSSSGGSGTSGSSSGGVDAGPPPTGTVGPTGGTVSRLYFAAVGDTRPANVDDTGGYPTAVITKIFADMATMSPEPTFGVSTGDYMFATPGKGNAAPQLDLYVAAHGSFTNTMFPAMGNHECTGYTASNCGSGNSDGITENYTAFLSQLLAPIQQTKPYYAINIGGTGGAWTAKFVFVAGNAWDSGQSSWLTSTLAQPTTYTFILRHEPASANTAPGVSPSEAIMAKYPYTLAIVGHTHTYQKSGSREVIIGNGGAPLSGGASYGFGLIQQRADSAIQVDMIDSSTMQPDPSFEFAVNADGSAAP